MNSNYVHASLAPWCLRAGVREVGDASVDAMVMECTINSDIDAFAAEIINENPDIISFSSYIWNIEKTFELCKILKKNIRAQPSPLAQPVSDCWAICKRGA